jgi:hypothetical protein
MKTMRWYDQYETLGRHIDSLKELQANRRDHLIRGIQALMQQHSPNLLDDSVLDFPLDLARLRWYDKDPYLWLTINGLQQADPDLLETVALYLEEESLTGRGQK